MGAQEFDLATDAVEALTELARAVFARRGEAATAELTRVHPAQGRPEGSEKAREGKR
jgi:hypothetical protein